MNPIDEMVTPMSTSTTPTRRTNIRPVLGQYTDQQLSGARRVAREHGDRMKLQSKSDSVIYCIGTCGTKLEASIRKFLASRDTRIQNLFDKLNIKHAEPIQRYSWPHMERQRFPLVCVAPRQHGKTYSYLIPFVTNCIRQTAAIDTDEIIKESLDSELSTKKADDFTTIDQLVTKVDKTTLSPDNARDRLDDINQDEFDFNTLGQEDCSIGADGKSAINIEQVEDELDKAEVNLGPRYLIVCSSLRQMKLVEMEIDRMKGAAFGNETAQRVRKDKLPPITKFIDNHHDDDRLAIRCAEAQILIASPTILLKALNSNYVDYSLFERIVYDDLDQAMQLHNSEIRELIKIYMAQSQQVDENEEFPETIFYAQKWTDLVRLLVSEIFPQKNILFTSLLEASIYAKMKYELEIYNDNSSKLKKLIDIIESEQMKRSGNRKLAILCNHDEEAKEVQKRLLQMGIASVHLPEKNALIRYKKAIIQEQQARKQQTLLVYVACDDALDILFEAMTDITILVNFSLPKELYSIDRRMRIMYKHIAEKSDGLITYLLVDRRFNNLKLGRELHDVLTRCPATLNSTKCEMRDLIDDLLTKVCWRWATTGVCKLDKFGKESAMASFCPDRHSLKNLPESNKWTGQGEVKITVTNVISPNEFYFWFEEHRDMESAHLGKTVWKKYDRSGTDYMMVIQPKLDQHKDKPNCEIPLNEIKRGQVYGVYFHEVARVDRIKLIDDPDLPKLTNHFDVSCAYSNIQCRVFKIDYGVEVNVYLRNLFRLDKSLAHLPAQCHRGFLLGIKPNHDEPYWDHRATKFFHEKIYIDDMQDVTMWARFNEGDCFWFEDCVLSRRLLNFDGSPKRVIPRLNLVEDIKEFSCTKVATDPSFIPKSQKSAFRSRWHVNLTASYSSQAFLRKDKSTLDLLVMRARPDLRVIVRNADYNKNVIDMEEDIMCQYKKGRLSHLEYCHVGVYCLGAIRCTDKMVLNRCKIVQVHPEVNEKTGKPDPQYRVFCLDHGDMYNISRHHLYHMPHATTTILPYQAIDVPLADYDTENLCKDKELTMNLTSAIYDLTRTPEEEEMVVVKAILEPDNKGIHIYIQDKETRSLFRPMLRLLEEEFGMTLSKNESQQIRRDLTLPESLESDNHVDNEQQWVEDQSMPEVLVRGVIRMLLETMVQEELSARFGNCPS